MSATAILRGFLFAVPMGAGALRFTPQEPQRPQSETHVLFAVQGRDRVQLDPIVMMRGDKLLTPPIGREEAAPSKFRAHYYAPGRRYRLLWANSVVGSVTAAGRGGDMCYGLAGAAALRLRASIPEDWGGLATNHPALGGRVLAWPATADDAKALAAIGQRMLRGRGVESDLIERLQPFGGTAVIALDTSGAEALVGGLLIRVELEHHVAREISLFLVAPRTEWVDAPTLTWFSDARGDRVQARRLVDVVDLDADAVPEIITLSEFYEWWDYTIYRLTESGWVQIYRGGGGGC